MPESPDHPWMRHIRRRTRTMATPLIESLAARLTPESSVLLYLSSGRYLPEFQDLPFDCVIAADRCHADNQFEGKVLKLSTDNNAVLRLLLFHHIQVDCVMAVNDGCLEGGNFECAYRGSALGRLFPILKDGSLWITDHGDHYQRWGFKPQTAVIPDGFPLLLARNRYGEIKAFRLRRNPRSTVEFSSGATRIRIVHDSACNHLPNLDTLLIPEHLTRSEGFGYFFHPLLVSDARSSAPLQEPPSPEITVMGSLPIQSILQVVRDQAARGMKRLGVLPAFGRFSRAVVEELVESDLGSVESIDFFHLDRSDFSWARNR